VPASAKEIFIVSAKCSSCILGMMDGARDFSKIFDKDLEIGLVSILTWKSAFN
jgi:hypothetical protein